MDKTFLMLTKQTTRITEIENLINELKTLIEFWGYKIEAIKDEVNKIKKEKQAVKKYIVAMAVDDAITCGIVDGASQKDALDLYKSKNAHKLENHSWRVISLCELDANIEISDLTNKY